MIALLKSEGKYADLIPTQKYYPTNQKLNVLEHVLSVCQGAKSSIMVYDPYTDWSILGLLKQTNAQEIKVMLLNPDKTFEVWAAALREQTGKSVEYKKIQSKDIHGRYVVVDDEEVWQIDGSINSKPIKGITITKITSEDERRKLINDLQKLWETQ